MSVPAADSRPTDSPPTKPIPARHAAPGYWSGKVVLITGGSSGLGFELAKTYAAQGAHVAIAARNGGKLEAAEQQFADARLDITTIVCDVTRDAQVESMIETIVDKFGQLDVLVNNVGRSSRSSVLETTPDDFQDLMEVNFHTTVRCTRAAMPHLIRSRGHLVNIGSLSAKTVSPYLSAYAASKFAVAAYTQQLRIEGPAEVHYLLVCPGPIAREDAGGRYDAQTEALPDSARKPAAGAKLKQLCPERLSKQILRACERRKPELVVPIKAKLLFVISQLWPSLGDWLIRRWT